jgi:hypothetical protein
LDFATGFCYALCLISNEDFSWNLIGNVSLLERGIIEIGIIDEMQLELSEDASLL